MEERRGGKSWRKEREEREKKKNFKTSKTGLYNFFQVNFCNVILKK